MPIFEVGQSSLTPVESTNYATVGLTERGDLQRLLRDQISVVAADVLVISEEFGEWTDSRRRIERISIGIMQSFSKGPTYTSGTVLSMYHASSGLGAKT